MNNHFLQLLLIIILVHLSGCLKDDDNHSSSVKVYKSDESIQCGSSGIKLDTMSLELINVGIDVICSQKGHDGFARTTVCGAETGNINIYQINRVNLPDAEALGFQSVTTLSEYQDQECRHF